MTTVGYGDLFPVTLEGRLIAIVLLVGGVGLFGILSGLLASHFVATADVKAQRDGILVEIRRLNEKLDALARVSDNCPKTAGQRSAGEPEP